MFSKATYAMKWIAAVLLVGLCLVTFSNAAIGQDVQYGVIAQKPIVNLPQDQGKWYVSVVGDQNDSRYQQLQKWFSGNSDLQNLRRQTHYNEILKGTATYKERYQPNVKTLPTVRVQDSEGRVIYEAGGNKLPYTAEGLYTAMARSILKHKGLSITGRRWRICPCPRPQPDDTPPPDQDPEPAPLDDGGAPNVEPPSLLDNVLSAGLGVLFVVDFIVSFLVGVAVSWYRQYNVKRG